ncbi:hypothetical protein IAQ61_006831 [Plenodomus lingam]|uniref:uncharacterized protein n=1 Tax=Leptosphaeria maculans TaxID=5022 RepID=UPI00332C7B12|nr:hypothetical protein IAQ61_006831 [Plenodomus lingam]
MPPHHHTLPVPAIPPTSKKSAPHGPAIIHGKSNPHLLQGMSWLQASGREYSPTWRNPAVPRSPSKLQGGPVSSEKSGGEDLMNIGVREGWGMVLDWIGSLGHWIAWSWFYLTWSVGYYRSRSPQAFRMDDAPSTHPSRCAFPCIESVET